MTKAEQTRLVAWRLRVLQRADEPAECRTDVSAVRLVAEDLLRWKKRFKAGSHRPAIRLMDDVVTHLPFQIHVIQTDNGSEFQSAFHWHLEGLDIRHVYIRPRTALLNGKAIAPRGRPGVLPAAGQKRGRGRHPAVQQEAAPVGELLQSPSAARRARWPDTLRASHREDERRVSPKS